MKVAVFGSRSQKKEQVARIFDILATKDIDLYIQERFYSYLTATFDLNIKKKGIIVGDDFNADAAISIGGDGTFLRTMSAIGKKDIPMLGVNTGRLGFLADVNDTDFAEAISDIEANRYVIQKRDLLHLRTEGKAFQGFNYALNEIAIQKQDSASMITVHAYVDGEYLSSYQADGLIIATPTGSTAYSMSVGGPIITPSCPCILLAPVAPHSLSHRPLVIDNHSKLRFDVESRNGSFLISLDGRSNVFSVDTKLSIEKADFSLKLIKRVNHTFYGTLRKKLMWGVDPRLGDSNI